MRAVLLTSLLLLLSACGDDAEPVDASAPTDTGPRDAGPPPSDAPLKGPWAQRPQTDGVRIRWESQLAPPEAAVIVTPEDGGEPETFRGTTRATEVRLAYGAGTRIVPRPDLPGTYHVNEVDIGGLPPATCFRYTIVGAEDAGGRFCTMHAPDDHDTPIRFFAIGDTSPTFMGTLRLLAAVQPETTEFTLHMGDIQYYSTVAESQQVWFDRMQPLLGANAFLPCVGNHESEVEHEYEDIYLRLFGQADEGQPNEWYPYSTGGVHFFSLSSEHDLEPGSEQLTWFENSLDEAERDPNYRFSIVYLHRPLYTLGDFVPRENHRAVLFPIIEDEERRIPLVLAGHVHGYERFEFDRTTYVTNGGGGFTNGEVNMRIDELPDVAARRVVAGDFHEAMIFEIVRNAAGDDVIRARVLDDMGMERDSFERIVTR